MSLEGCGSSGSSDICCHSAHKCPQRLVVDGVPGATAQERKERLRVALEVPWVLGGADTPGSCASLAPMLGTHLPADTSSWRGAGAISHPGDRSRHQL